jgi:PAS domain S-box-containing protein
MAIPTSAGRPESARDGLQRYRHLAERTPALIFSTDATGAVDFVNERWTAMTGVPAPDLLGEGWKRVVHPDDLERLVRAWTRALRSGAPFVTEWRLRRAGGEYGYVQTHVESECDERGRIVACYGTGFDTEEQHRERERREAEFRMVADTMPQLLWTTDRVGNADWFNQRWYAYTGYSPGDYEREPLAHLHPDDIPAMSERWTRSVRTGKPFEMEFRIRRHDGAYRWFLTRANPTRDAFGRILRWYGSNTDVDDVRRAARTLQAFADIGETLSESLGLQETLEAAMEVIVPEYADWSYINLLDETGALRIAAAYHGDPLKNAKLAAEIGEVYARTDRNVGSVAAMRAREPILYRAATYEDGARVIEPGVLETFFEVGFSSVLGVPLVVGATVRGMLNLVMHGSRREFTPEDVPFYREIARRFAPAIANAELYERERRVARSFQEAALPKELPDRPGFRFSAIYEAGRAEALIGGDWYDAFPLVDGRIVISIGDVAGSGLQAAVTMANVRQTIRGVAHVHADPMLMLEAADRTLRAETPDRFVTAFVGVLDAVTRTITYASAGHPPPLLCTSDGRASELLPGGLPLGLRENARGVADVCALPDDAMLVLYTDGLTESTHDVQEGERRLHAALVDPAVVGAEHPALALYRAVLIEGTRDDVAILTVTLGTAPTLPRWSFEAADAAAAHRAQHEIGERLRAAGYAPTTLDGAALVISELIGNTVRYAPGPIDVLLERDGDAPVVHVLDRGPGFEFAAKLPPDLYSETGRGLFLIAALAEDLHVVRRPDGGSHARVVLRT